MIAKRPTNYQDRSLGWLVGVSAVVHLAFAAFLFVMPASAEDEDSNKPKAIMFNIEVADRLGTGLGLTPKKGPDNPMGKITAPPPAPPEQPKVETEPTVQVADPNAKKIPEPKKIEKKTPTPQTPDVLAQAINQLNEGRTGEYTTPDGDPNSKFTGPGGTPGGDACAVYRNRAAKYIRRSGSVPEAAGKTVRISVVIGPSGGVVSRSITQSSGLPVADKVALGLVPGSFGVPPAECGNVTLRVTVKFDGGQSSKMPDREERPKPTPKPSHVPSEVDRALQELN